MQFNLFNGQVNSLTSVELPDADVRYQSDWIPSNEAIQLYTQLTQTLPWRQDTIKLYGREVNIPRLQSWHGAPHCEYTYSNLRMMPKPMPEALMRIQRRLNQQLHTSFNCVLANWYRDGDDGMGMHADDEPELGPTPTIASVSLGDSRRFTFKHLQTGKRTNMYLEPGSLLVMQGTTQQFYHHGLSKTRKPTGGRINLTFRYIPQTDFINKER